MPDDEKGADSELGDKHTDEVLESGPDTQSPRTEPGAEAGSEPAEGDKHPEPEAKKEESPPAPPPPRDWRDKEMLRRKQRLEEANAAKAELEAENRRLRDLAESLAKQQPALADGETPPPAPRQPSGEPTFTRAQLEAEAQRLADDRQFKKDFEGAYQKAADVYGKGKVDAAISRISELGGLDVDHINMMLATEQPEKVLYELGSKPEEFQRIMELPFNRRVAEIVKMGLKTETKAPAVSRAPAPVEPIGGRGGSVDNRYDERASDDDWFREEEKRSAAAWKKKQEGWRN